MQGPLTKGGYVPEQHTDFIFSAVGEQFGFARRGGVLALSTRCSSSGCCGWPSSPVTTSAPSCAAASLRPWSGTSSRTSGMTMGIMPITGIPLPFMSYGGSSTIAFFAMIGLVQNVHMRRFVIALTRPARGPGLAWTGHDALAPARAPAGQGAEAGPLHRVRGRRRRPRPRARSGGLAARLPRHLRDRAAQPGPADPLRDPERARRRRGRAVLRAVDRPRGRAAPGTACRCSRSTPTARPATSTCSPSTCRPSSSTRTSSTASTWPACRSARPTAGPSTRWSAPAATAPTTPSRWPTSSTSFVIGDGEEVVGEITEVVRRVEGVRSDRGQPRAGAPRARRDRRASTCRRCTTSTYDGAHPRGRHAPLPRRAGAGREAHHRRPGRLALPQAPARAAHRGGARPAQRRGVPGLHPGLPVLPGRA